MLGFFLFFSDYVYWDHNAADISRFLANAPCRCVARGAHNKEEKEIILQCFVHRKMSTPLQSTASGKSILPGK